jgi:Ca2+-binding RTX toxin-like protein
MRKTTSKKVRTRFTSKNCHARSRRPLFETLESRLALATVYGITAGNVLIRFDSATPAAVTTIGTVSGLGANETVRGIDFRPRTGELIGSTVTTGSAANSVIFTYSINPLNAQATFLGATAAALAGAADVETGYDFNPNVDRIRYVNTNDENARLVATDPVVPAGSLAGNDTDLTPAATTTIIAAAYDRNFDRAAFPPNSIPTTLYVIDRNDSQISIQGGIGGTPSPNGGVITDLAPLGVTLDATAEGGFDIVAGLNNSNGELGAAFAALTVGGVTGFYSITLPTSVSATPAATLVGSIGNGATQLISIAVVPPPLPTVSVSDASTTEGADVVFDVTLSSPSTQQVTVRVNTVSNSATGDVDYAQISPFVDVVFAPGETTKPLVVATIDDDEIELDETFVLNVLFAINATVADGQGLGTITDDDLPPPGTAGLFPDPENPGEQVLFVTGTARSDSIVVKPVSGQVRVFLNGRNIGSFSPHDFGRILVFAGAGNDTVVIARSLTNPTSIDGEAGNDTLVGGNGPDTLIGGPGRDTLVGLGGEDLLLGGDGNDVLDGGSGNDELAGEAGNDTLVGGSGNDLLSGGDGNDVMSGGSGNDELSGDAGNDVLNGNGGNDLADGGEGNDTVVGAGGNDSVFGGDGNDKVYGGSGNDLAQGGLGSDKVFGEAGNDLLLGEEGNDQLFGGAGRDILLGGADADTLFGEGGDDILVADTTSIDSDESAAADVFAEWTSANPYVDRVNNIRALGISIFDDGAIDTLWGQGGLDWFLFSPGDRLKDRSAGELVN